MEKISSTLASLRKEYGNKELDVDELSENPINQFKKWFHRCGGIKLLGNRDKSHFMRIKDLYQLGKVGQGARQAIYLVNHNDLNAALSNIFKQLLNSRALKRSP